MKRFLVVVASGALLVLAGAAALPSGIAAEPWKPTCTVVGCLEAEVGTRAPIGAELSFGQCADGENYRYRFQRQATGWVLVSYLGETVDRCPDPPIIFARD